MYFCDNPKCHLHIKLSNIVPKERFWNAAGQEIRRFQIPKMGGSIYLCESCKNAVDISKPWR
jgi:hypothetical protein